MGEEDILQVVLDEDIPKLREIYKKDLPRAAYIYNYLESVTKWRTQCPEKNCITLMAPHGHWKSGTFVSIHEYSCYELFMFTLEEDCKTLCEALINTRKIKWNNAVILYALHGNLIPKVLQALEKTPFKPFSSSTTDAFWIPKEKAIKFEIECPPDVYIANLNSSHAEIINGLWPPRYEGSEKYLATMIEMSGGLGLFLKSDDTLVAWGIRNLIGLGALQTVEEHKRKGYGSLVTKALSKDIAEKGADPVGTVHETNVASQTMFKKLGFETFEKAVYVESQEMRS